MISDFSIERSASCVPITYMSCASGEAGSHGTREAGGALPCMFHVPTKSRSEASSGGLVGAIPLPYASPCGRSRGRVTAGEHTGFAFAPPFAEPKSAAELFAGMLAGTVVGGAAGTACGTAGADAAAGTGTAIGANGRKVPPAIGAVWRGDGDHGEMAGIGESRARTGKDEVDGGRPTQGGSPGGGGGSGMCVGSAGGSVSSPPDCCLVALQRAASACGLAVRSNIASASSSGSSAAMCVTVACRLRAALLPTCCASQAVQLVRWPLLPTAPCSTRCSASSHVKRGKDTHGTTGPESGTRGMRGSKPAGFTGVGERAARSLDRVSRRRGPRRAAGASLEQRDLLDDVCRVREHSRGHDAGEVVGEVVRRVEAAVGGAVAPALPA